MYFVPIVHRGSARSVYDQSAKTPSGCNRSLLAGALGGKGRIAFPPCAITERAQGAISVGSFPLFAILWTTVTWVLLGSRSISISFCRLVPGGMDSTGAVKMIALPRREIRTWILSG